MEGPLTGEVMQDATSFSLLYANRLGKFEIHVMGIFDNYVNVKEITSGHFLFKHKKACLI